MQSDFGRISIIMAAYNAEKNDRAGNPFGAKSDVS